MHLVTFVIVLLFSTNKNVDLCDLMISPINVFPVFLKPLRT